MLIHARLVPPHRIRRLVGRALRWAGVAAAAAALPLAAQNGASPEGPRLSLTREAELRLPDTLTIAGAALSAGGRLVTWTGIGPQLTVITRDGVQRLGGEVLVRPIGAALLEDDSVVAAFDLGDTLRVVRLSRSGRLLGEWPVELPFTPENAVRAGEGWVVAGRDTADGFFVARLAGPDTAAEVRPLDFPKPEGMPLYATHLAACGSTLYVASRRSPLRLLRVGPDGAADLITPGLLETLPGDSLSGGRDFHWGAAPPVCLERGVAVTLVDLRSDTRVMLHFDGEGRLVRSTTVHAPLALIASEPASRAVVALRRLNATDVVWYRWRWGGEDP